MFFCMFGRESLSTFLCHCYSTRLGGYPRSRCHHIRNGVHLLCIMINNIWWNSKKTTYQNGGWLDFQGATKSTHNKHHPHLTLDPVPSTTIPPCPHPKAAHRASHEFADAHAGGHRLWRVGGEPKKSKEYHGFNKGAIMPPNPNFMHYLKGEIPQSNSPYIIAYNHYIVICTNS